MAQQGCLQHTLYGSHICGEGGEYETLTLDCPLFKRRITLYVITKYLRCVSAHHRFLRTDVETVIHSDNDFATVAFLRINNAILEPKNDANPLHAHTPPLLDPDFGAVMEAVKESQESVLSPQISDIHGPEYFLDPWQSCPMDIKHGPWIAVANIHRDLSEREEITLEAEVQECFHKLQGTSRSAYFF